MNKSLFEYQKEFMLACSQHVGSEPVTPTEYLTECDTDLWSSLVEEEHSELHEALGALDLAADDDPEAFLACLAEVCAEGVDVIYTVSGLLNDLGLPAETMFQVVHEANMAKRDDDGFIHKDPETGKVLKPMGWRPVNKIKVVLEAQEV